MTAKMIFKMEMYKFKNDKPYLIAAAILGVLNIIITFIVVSTTGGLLSGDIGINSSGSEAAIITLITVTPLLAIGNAVFMFIYPFHAVAIDYKNNVMAMLFASGVNRKNMYFAKIGAIVLSTLLLSIAISIVPIIIVLVKISSGIELKEALHAISEFFGVVDINFIQYVLLGILGYINTVIMIVFSSIFQKGAKLTFLVYVAISMAASMAKGVLSTIPLSMDLGAGGYITFEILWVILSMVVFAYGSLKLLETQDL